MSPNDPSLEHCLSQQFAHVMGTGSPLPMMGVISVGMDLLNERRVTDIVERYGDRFAKKILTKTEYLQWQEAGARGNRLAKQFSAKEAVVKALGTGFRQGVTWQQIEVLRSDLGQPQVALTDKALQLMHDQGGQRVLISLSDEKPWVHAMALLCK